MSVMDSDPDEVFNKIVEGLVLEEPTDAVDFTLLSDVGLARRYHKIREELNAMGKLHELNPTGDAADLHSQFAAIHAEITRRSTRRDTHPNG